ncbi:MAG: sigma factor-like helix-turn-helix DNA-binding protein [Armatimonadota bacterium]
MYFLQEKANIHETLFSELPDPEWAAEVQQSQQEASLVEQVSAQQTRQCLQRIIEQVCSTDERRVILLQEQGERLEAIAQMLRLNPSTVRTHLMRGRAKVLAYIVQHEPALVGGSAAIEHAIERHRRESNWRDQLTVKELDALRHPERNQRLLRKACLKIARFLWIAQLLP